MNFGGSIATPIIAIIGYIVVLGAYVLMTDGVNGFFLLTHDAGKVDGARVDQVVGFASGEASNEAWFDNALTLGAGSTATTVADNTYYKLEQDGTGCQLVGLANTDVTVGKAYTQGGAEVEVNATGDVAGCIWTPSDGVWEDGGFLGLIRLIFEGAALALPIGVLYIAYAFGKNFLTSLGVNPLIAVLVMVIMFLMATRLADTLTPYVSDASDSVGSPRFSVYGSGLGKLGAVVSNFYGVVLAASFLRLGWEALKVFMTSGRSMGINMGGMGGRGSM